jgi:Protein-arginine deiminase (PAD)
VKLKIGQVADLQGVRIFKAIAAGEQPIWGPGVHDTEELLDITPLIKPNTPLELGIEGLYFAGVKMKNGQVFDGEIDLELGIEEGGVFKVQDKVRMHVVPWLMIGNREPKVDTFASNVRTGLMGRVDQTGAHFIGSDANTSFLTSISSTGYPFVEKRNFFSQDDVEIGYAHLPGGPKTHATLRLSLLTEFPAPTFLAWPKGTPTTPTLLGKDLGLFSTGDGPFGTPGNLGGDLELSVPTEDHPLGRIIYGNTADAKLTRFLQAQSLDGQPLQKPIEITVDWLEIGHVDEIFGFTGRKIGETEEVLVASPRKAYEILRTLPPTALFFSSEDNPLAAEIDTYNPASPNQIQLKAGPNFSSRNWTGMYVRIYEGAGRGLVGRISSLTNTGLLTVDRVWATGYTVKDVSNGFDDVNFENSLNFRPVSYGIDWTVVGTTPLPSSNNKVVLFSDTLFYWLRVPPDAILANQDAPPAAITVQEILQDQVLEQFNVGNDGIQSIITDFAECELFAEIAVTFREVPVLFCQGTANPFNNGAKAFTPNLANCQPLSTEVVFPRPWGPRVGNQDTFEAAVQTVANKVFVDDWLWYHLFGGEVHCATAVKRQFPASDWWMLFP